jgi:hypothetical protein
MLSLFKHKAKPVVENEPIPAPDEVVIEETAEIAETARRMSFVCSKRDAPMRKWRR